MATFTVTPEYANKFKASKVKEMLAVVLNEKLRDQKFNADSTTQWTKEISDEIKSRLKDMALDRYKFVVQVVIGEQRGEGVRMGARCFWDEGTDNYAQEVFMNNHLFCVAAAFGIYFY